ncbi:MAG: hypothetical protein QNJ85_08390 [Gammaproteobacteria bacterium]|nr:hypothetical protein [Gammaproteobacteria bacterium]
MTTGENRRFDATAGDSIYRTPRAELTVESSANEFYVVSKLKFAVLYLATLGLYEVYWFYRHWHQYRLYHGESLWPVPRAIFSIVFAYPLFRRFERRNAAAGDPVRWSPGVFAGLYILLYLVSNFAELAAPEGEDAIAILVAFVAMILALVLLQGVQDIVNRAVGDPDASVNRRFSVANIAWITVGLLFWSMTLIGLAIGLGLFNPPV